MFTRDGNNVIYCQIFSSKLQHDRFKELLVSRFNAEKEIPSPTAVLRRFKCICQPTLLLSRAPHEAAALGVISASVAALFLLCVLRAVDNGLI